MIRVRDALTSSSWASISAWSRALSATRDLETLGDARVGDGSRTEPEDEPTQVADRPVEALDSRLQARPNRRVRDRRSEGLKRKGDAEEELNDPLLQFATDPIALGRDRA